MRPASAPPVRGKGRSVFERIANPRVWLVEVLVLAIFIGNELLTGESGSTPSGSLIDLAVEALFVVPILYAALNFGVAGSLLTGGWVTALLVGGDAAVDLANRRYHDALTDAVMLVLLDAVAVFVGWRMAVEQSSRDRYWDLFESSEAPVLIVDAAGTIREANAAARRTLELPKTPPHLRAGRERAAGPVAGGALLAQVLGPPAAVLLDGRVALVTPPGADATFRAVPSPLRSVRGEAQLQVVLENLTESMRRERVAAAYARHVLAGQEDERRRVAQELHDGPVQRLVQLCRALDLVDEQEDIVAARRDVVAARDLAELIVTELREILRGLRPPALEHLGLVPTLRRLLDELAQRSGISAHLVVEGGVRRLDGDIELSVFRIGQEALTNVERHAGASAVTLTLDFGASVLTLTVRDDGAGFDAAGLLGEQGSSGLGLRGMVERVELVGGELEVHSRPGAGTEVVARVPLPSPAPAPIGVLQA